MYGPAWKFYRKIFVNALRKYLSNIPLVEDRVTTQAEKLVQFVEEQRGELFDPADRLMKAVADVICAITFKDGSHTCNPDLGRIFKLNVAFAANVGDFQKVLILDFFPWTRYLPTKVYERWMAPMQEIHDIIRKRLRQTKEKFDPTEPVEDLCQLFFALNLTLKENVEQRKRKPRCFLKIVLLRQFMICLLQATKPQVRH